MYRHSKQLLKYLLNSNTECTKQNEAEYKETVFLLMICRGTK